MRKSLTKKRNEFGDYLKSIYFDYFCTFTTPYKMTLPSARRAVERFGKLIEKYYPKYFMFWSAEPFDLKEGYHLHSLIKTNSNSTTTYLDKKVINEIWQIATKGSSIKAKSNKVDIRKYKAGKRGSNYFCKYIKRPHSDYDFIYGKNYSTSLT